ncbi:hypothetical protein LVJ94_34640 [Pendulispora rubella]|uniref:DNA ligase (ATP) n=1 Tax=Pendulispora rubella TaxID=2741070 RepID=A0ABZ2KW92_9BACT
MRPLRPAAEPPTPERLAALLEKVPPQPQEVGGATIDEIAPAELWRCELKLDGYRVVAYCHGGDIALRTREGVGYTREFPAIVDALRQMNFQTCVLDGEVCAINDRDLPDFNLLQNRASAKGLRTAYFVFDVLWLGRLDMREKPLEVRQEALHALLGVRPPSGTIVLSPWTDAPPAALLEHARKRKYEGIVAKQLGSKYGVNKRAWLKVKCDPRQEFAVVGFVPQVGTTVVGSLILAVWENDRFVFAGKVSTGLKDKQRREFARALRENRIETPMVEGVPKKLALKTIWAQPTLVVEVRYRERTTGGHLRHPTFWAQRKDKQPKQCVWELPAKKA